MRDWDPKSQPPNDENDDDLNWDWLSDAEQKETGSSDRTGVTGQLSWQGGQQDSTSDEEEPGDKASFDWQTRKPGQGPQSSETGLTGNLDWQKNRFSGIPLGSETGLTGNLDWQEGAFTQHPDTVPETPAPAAPDASWDEELGAEDSENDTLYGWPEGAEIPAPPSTGETDQLLDWMANSGDSADESAVDDTPDWMLGLDEEASPSLRPAPSGPIASIDDTPDWMLDLDQADSEPAADETPDWMLGLDEPTPASPSQSSGDVDLPPWLADMDTDSASEEDAAAPIADLESAYEWSPYDEQGAEQPSAEDNFFDTLGPDTADDLSFDGTFGVEDEEPVSEASGLDDFDFESLVGQQSTQDDFGSDELDFDSLFAEANVEDEPAAPAPIPAPDSLNLDDMFAGEGEITDDAWLNEFEPDEQPVADEEMDFSSFFPEDDDEAEPNYMADIVASGRGNQDEWFNEPEAVADEDPNWLDSLEDISLDDVIDTPPAAAKPAPATPSRPTPSPKPPEVDLDAMFADTDTSMPSPVARGYNTFDLNAFADIPDDDSIPAFATQDNPDVPDWLREAAASTDDQLSAAGIIRQKYTDRPIESLDDRLKALREAGLNLSSSPEEAPERRRVLETVLPGVEDALAPGAAIGGTAAALDSALRVTPDQLKNASLLRSLVGHSSAAELDKAKARRPSRTAPPILRVVIMAVLLVAVLVPFFVTLNLDIVEKPSAEFVAGSPGANAFVRIATLPAGARVLVAAEYGPTGAAELDPMLRALLTHILSKSAQPILVSTNPVGMRHAQNIMIELAGEGNNGRAYYVLGYQPGALLGLRNLDANASTLFSTDVQGEKIGLNIDSLDDVALALIVAENAESVQSWVEQTRIGRQVPVLLASSVAAAPLILPYAQQGQVAGVLTGYRDAVTYTHMLAGLGDLSMTLPDLPTQVILPTALPVTPTDIPPTTIPTQEITVEPTAEATQAILVEPTEISVTATPEETATPTEISVTATPEEPTATDTRAPTATPSREEATVAPTATTGPGLVITPPSAGNMVEVAIVIAQSNVNTRSGPGTEFDIVRALAPGAQVRVVDYNDDRSWVQVELADGEQAWIAEFLVAIREVPASEAGPMTPQPPRRSQRTRGQRVPGERIAQNETPAFDPTMLTIDPALMLTAQAAQDFALTQAAGAGIALTAGVVPSLDPSLAETQAAVLTQAAVDLNVTVPTISSDLATTLTPGASLDGSTIPLSVPDLPNTNERWNATTFGLVAAIVIIILGNVVAGLRALAGRRR